MGGLFEPCRVAGLDLPNRLVMAPMTRAMSPGGVPGPDVAAYYRRRIEGGIGLIVTEGTWIDHPSASNEERAPRFYGEDALAGWAEVVAQVHDAGGRIMPQLWHTGLTHRPATKHIYDGSPEDFDLRVSPSGYVAVGERIGDPMAEATARDIVDAYARGAATAERMGFDGIELHGAHGYLIDQFLWAETNFRDDHYGGDAGERTRFGVEVVRACRAAVSPGFPIVLRFSQWKLQDYDARIAATAGELESILTPFADAGVDIFHASQRRYREPEFEGSSLNLAGWAKKLTGKPSITVGSIGLAVETRASMTGEDIAIERIDRAEEMLAAGEVDLVAIGRMLLSDPDWPHKVRRAEWDTIVPFNRDVMATLL